MSLAGMMSQAQAHRISVCNSMTPRLSGRLRRQTGSGGRGMVASFSDTLAGFLVASALVVAGAVLVHRNESRSASAWWYTQHVLQHVVRLANTEVVYPENNGHLIYLQAPLHTNESIPDGIKVLNDSIFDVGVHATKLQRHVWVYQWVETSEDVLVDEGDTVRRETVYTYRREWRDTLVGEMRDISKINPPEFLVRSLDLVVTHVHAGAFVLNEHLMADIQNFKILKLTRIPKLRFKLPGKRVNITADGAVFFGNNWEKPSVGDLSVRFLYAGAVLSEDAATPADTVSIMAEQAGHHLKRYSVDSGDWLETLAVGKLTPSELVLRMKEHSALIAWASRCGGLALTALGFTLSTLFLATVSGRWYRLVARTGRVHLGLCLALSLSLTLTALAWYRYKPAITAVSLSLATSFLLLLLPRKVHQP